MMNQPEDWRSSQFRHGIILKLEDQVQKCGSIGNNSSTELENQIFMKANTKEEYLAYVAKLILRFRSLHPNMMSQQGIPHQGIPPQGMSQQGMPPQGMPMQPMQQQVMGQPGLSQQGMQPQGMPQQGMPPGHPTATNLLQSLSQGRAAGVQNRMPMQVEAMNSVGGSLAPMQQSGMQQGNVQSGMIHGGPMNQINVVMGNQMNQNVNQSLANVIAGPGTMINASSMSGQGVNPTSMANAVSMSGPMPNSMSGPMPGQVGNVMSGQMVGQVPSQMGGGIMHGQINAHMAGQQRKMVPEGMMMQAQGGVSYMQPRGAVPSHFVRQGAPPSGAAMMQVNTVGNSLMSLQSPGMFSSTSPTQMNSSGLVGPVMRPTGPLMTPSPSNVSLNTPGGQSQPTPSPLSNEEQAYRDKVKQLSRYIEPLRRMIARSGSGDHEKMGKMKKLLEILSSPSQRITMEALLKCEAVLEKMDIKGLADKEQHPLIEAVSAALQNPNPNHTFQRTFELVMTTLNGKPLKTLPKPLKRKHVEEVPNDIPEALQGEVARLDQRFKVSLDPVQQTSPKCVYLLCWLDDRNLPCIPPVQIAIPEDYPNSSPKCNLSNYEYGATKFLQMIQKALQSRISKLSSKYTMSQLLDTWENSVRETCSSDRINSLSTVF